VRSEEIRRKPNAAFQSIYKIYASSKNESNNQQLISPRTSINSNDVNPNEILLDDHNNINNLNNNNIHMNDNVVNSIKNGPKDENTVLSLSQLNGIDHYKHNNNYNSRNTNVSSFYDNNNDNYNNYNNMNTDTLKRLKEMYAKNTLPPSLKPDSLSKSFLSDPRQQAIKNDPNSTLLNQMKNLF